MKQGYNHEKSLCSIEIPLNGIILNFLVCLARTVKNTLIAVDPEKN